MGGLDEAIAELEKISIRSNPEEFKRAVSELHRLLTDDRCTFKGDTIAVSNSAVRNFINQIDAAMEPIMAIYRGFSRPTSQRHRIYSALQAQA